MFKQRSLQLAVLACAALVAGSACAEVNGGGSTAVKRLYTGNPLYPKLPRLLPDGFSYSAVNSLAGKQAFLANDPTLIWQAAGGTVDFAAGEAVLTASELASYRSTRQSAYGPMIQVPVAGMAVAIPYQKSGLDALQLSAQQLCGVFSGALATWGQVLGTADSTPVRVVYRAGDSGTTEVLSRFLNDSCPSAFRVSSRFTTASLATPPGHWLAVATSADVTAQVSLNEGAIGYVAANYTEAGKNSKVARVSKQPMAAGMAALPTVLAAQAGLGTPQAPASAAERGNPLRWVPTYGSAAGDLPVAGTGYPIVGFSNLLLGQCYQSAADTRAIRDFLGELFAGQRRIAVMGHIFVTLPQPFADELRRTFLFDAYGEGTDIGNPSVCNGIGRP
ncbi:substrate-binding domain-containing protein [Pseudomonas muyukensis]|uniref:Substrate-binding domain-containing protein n=1 Tax=Pseudomonas muyukensis TaxID=2842357 RepID=A0ABX8M5E0_9PSED|nr:substrate-binding domain-containing protein [Pseudomonas muyukensis]QXH33459.1 substrate-binding domain-containing protein [Pseudomonas muyukensis]